MNGMRKSVNLCIWGKSMHMGRSNSKTVSYMKEGDKRVPTKYVSEDKNLAVTFCETIKYDDHMLNCVNKANRILGIILILGC